MKTKQVIILSGLLVGTLDILTAFTDYYIATGKGPEGVLRFVASGVLGMSAFQGNISVTLFGLLFHYIIAFIWTLLFFFLYPRIKVMRLNPILTGVLYGIIIWAIMNRVVVPASSAPPLPFKLASAIKAMIILIVMIGLPLSFIAKRHFATRA